MQPPPALTLWAHLLLWSPSVSPDPRAKPSVLSGCSFPFDKMVKATLSYLPGRGRGSQRGEREITGWFVTHLVAPPGCLLDTSQLTVCKSDSGKSISPTSAPPQGQPH